MPRQTFLTRESFVDATEQHTREALRSIPAFLASIHFVSENRPGQAYRFLYDQKTKKVNYHIDVSVLPLNDQYTRISLHASHVNGQAFYTDADLSFALHDFESAVHAAVKGDLAQFKAAGQVDISRNQTFGARMRSLLHFLLLREKLS